MSDGGKASVRAVDYWSINPAPGKCGEVKSRQAAQISHLHPSPLPASPLLNGMAAPSRPGSWERHETCNPWCSCLSVPLAAAAAVPCPLPIGRLLTPVSVLCVHSKVYGVWGSREGSRLQRPMGGGGHGTKVKRGGPSWEFRWDHGHQLFSVLAPTSRAPSAVILLLCLSFWGPLPLSPAGAGNDCQMRKSSRRNQLASSQT